MRVEYPQIWAVSTLRLSLFRINVRLTVRQKCHPFGRRWYQVATLWMRRDPRIPLDFISLPPSPAMLQCGNVGIVGVTYRDWDWGCGYSACGASGKPELDCLACVSRSRVNRFSDRFNSNPIAAKLDTWMTAKVMIIMAMVSSVIGFLLVLCSDQKRVISC